MSSFINKAKDKLEATLERSSNKGDNPRSDNYGPHGSNVTNRMDPTVDSDLDNRNNPASRVGGYGNTQAPDQYGHQQGPGGFATSDTYGSSTNNPGYENPRSDNAGPHSSNLMNKVDPRVDSDRDNRNDPTSRVGGYGNTQQYGDNLGQAGGPGGMGTTDTGYGRTSATGPGGYGGVHETSTTGYQDPAATHLGHTGHQTHTGHMGHSGPVGGLAANTTTGAPGQGGYDNTYNNPASTNEGPHRSNMMNKLDPRTDSDRDHRNDPTSRVGGYGAQGDDYGHTAGIQGGPRHTGPTHTGPPHTGPTGAYGAGEPGYDNSSYTPGSGDASKTAGPHNSNIMNTLDPRVDSDMDGSKTYGGNQTYR